MTKLADFVKKLLDTLNVRSYGEKILYDLQESWYYIVIGIFAGAFISFIWIIMMRFVAAVMVWASIILSILMLGIVYVQTYFGKNTYVLSLDSPSLNNYKVKNISQLSVSSLLPRLYKRNNFFSLNSIGLYLLWI